MLIRANALLAQEPVGQLLRLLCAPSASVIAGLTTMRADFKRHAMTFAPAVSPNPHRPTIAVPSQQDMTTERQGIQETAPTEAAASQAAEGMVELQPKDENGSLPPVGRRSAPRLRISLPGQLIAVDKVHSCIVMNLSRTGAQVAILDSLRKGEGAILRCGALDHFAIVTRSEFGLNALTFDEPLSDALVLELRRYHENFEERERRALIDTARKWVTGDNGDDRPI